MAEKKQGRHEKVEKVVKDLAEAKAEVIAMTRSLQRRDRFKPKLQITFRKRRRSRR